MSGKTTGASTEAPSPAKLRAVVAERRSVVVDGRRHGPGSVIELHEDDHAHLLAAGFIHDSRIQQVAPSAGPQFSGPNANGVVKLG